MRYFKFLHDPTEVKQPSVGSIACCWVVQLEGPELFFFLFLQFVLIVAVQKVLDLLY